MRRSFAKSRVVLACVVAFSMVLPVLGVSSAAIANGGTASISGTVTGPGGVPIEGIHVNAYRWDSGGSTWVYQNSGDTNPDGTYTAPGLIAGTYAVYFDDPANVYTGEYWDNQTSWGTATQFALADAEAKTGVSAELAVASTLLSGTLSDSVSGEGARGVEGTLWRNTGLDTWDVQDRATTRADGGYSFPGIPDGTYRLQFTDTDPSYNRAYETVYYHDQTAFDSATYISIASGVLPPLVADQDIDPIPQFTGTVTEAGTGDPLGDITVSAYRWGVGIDATTTTAPDGTYAFYNLYNSQYTALFEDQEWSDGRHRTEWWNDAPTYDFAEAFAVIGGSTVPDVDASLLVYEPAISGHVTEAGTGLPLNGASVQVFAYDSTTLIDTAYADATGYYEFSDLLDGTYKLFFAGPTFRHLAEWWDEEDSWTDAWTVYYDGVSGEVVDEDLVRYQPESERVYHNSRYTTAIKAARQVFDSNRNAMWQGPAVPVTHVIIASGEDRAAADPLAAAGLVHIYDAPMFLVRSDKALDEVKYCLRQIATANGDITLHVVGGNVSVPEIRVDELVEYTEGQTGQNVTVDRILASGGRYDLAAAIARRIKQVDGTPPVVLVANGADPAKFFDALALSPIAASKGYPVLLVSANKVPPATSAVISEFGSPRVIVGGGPNTVSEAVRKALGAKAADRWYGQNRYSTATTIAEKAVTSFFCTYDYVGIAAKLPDALTGGSVVGYRGGVLVITDGLVLSSPTATFLEAHDGDIRYCWVFGGPNSVWYSVQEAIDAKLMLP